MKSFIIFLSCFVFITLISVLVSCKKAHYEKPACEKLYGSWRMTSLNISAAFTGTEDIFFKQQLENCSNVFSFFVDGGYFAIVEGETKRHQADVQKRGQLDLLY